jgi:hypothetical protein
MPFLSDSALYWFTAACAVGMVLRSPPQRRLRAGIVGIFFLLIVESPHDQQGRITGPGEGLVVFMVIAVLVVFFSRAWWAKPSETGLK